MAGTSNIAPLTAAGAGALGSALNARNSTHKHKPKVSHSNPALTSRFGNISELRVALAVLANVLALATMMSRDSAPDMQVSGKAWE
jgi:cation transporter-like permease